MIKIYGTLTSTKSIDGLLKRIARRPDELDEKASEMIQRSIPFHQLREYFCNRVYALFGKRFPIKDVFYKQSKKPTSSYSPLRLNKGITSLKVDSKRVEHFLSDLKFKDPEENKKPTKVMEAPKTNVAVAQEDDQKKKHKFPNYGPAGKRKKNKNNKGPKGKHHILDPNSPTYQSEFLKQELKNKYKDYEYGLSDW